MVRQAHARFTQLLVAACVFVACQSGPSLRRDVTIRDGERTAVVLVSSNGRLTLSLQNESAALANAVYTANSADPSRKVVADADLQALLDVFSELGLFAAANPVVPPDARDVLFVDHGGKRHAWVRRHLGAQASERSFHDARDYFLALYNSSIAYHGTPDTPRPNFTGEVVRAKVTAETARARLEQLRTGNQ
jgi:hypothetical protein